MSKRIVTFFLGYFKKQYNLDLHLLSIITLIIFVYIPGLDNIFARCNSIIFPVVSIVNHRKSILFIFVLFCLGNLFYFIFSFIVYFMMYIEKDETFVEELEKLLKSTLIITFIISISLYFPAPWHLRVFAFISSIYSSKFVFNSFDKYKNKEIHFDKNLIIIFCISFLVRVIIPIYNPTYNLHMDEALYLYEGKIFAFEKQINIFYDAYTIFPLIIAIWFSFVGANEYTGRLLMILIGSFVPVLVYKLLATVDKDEKHTYVGFLSAFSPLLIYYSHLAFLDIAMLIVVLWVLIAFFKNYSSVKFGVVLALAILIKAQAAIILIPLIVLFFILYKTKKTEIKDNVLWGFKTAFIFLFLIFPFIIVLKGNVLFASEKNLIGTRFKLLLFSEIINNFWQYWNWSSLGTINIHSGSQINNYFLFVICNLAFLYGLLKSIRFKEKKYILALSILLMSIGIYSVLLTLTFQRYTLPIHVAFLIFVSLSLEDIKKFLVRNFVRIRPCIYKIRFKNLKKSLIDIKYLFHLCVFLFLFLITPAIVQDVSNEKLVFDRQYALTREFLDTSFDKNSFIIFYDHPWYGDWYFSNFNKIKLKIYDNNLVISSAELPTVYQFIVESKFNVSLLVLVPIEWTVYLDNQSIIRDTLIDFKNYLLLEISI